MYDRKQEQVELIFMLGQLFGPLIELAENPELFDRWERSRFMARFSADHPKFYQAFNKFCNSEPGHYYELELRLFSPLFNIMLSQIDPNFEDMAKFKSLINDTKKKILDILLSIPIPQISIIHEAWTPFSTYCFLKDRCLSVLEKLIWVDRYFDPTIFYRYLRYVPNNIKITLITWPENKFTTKKDIERFKEFIDVSNIFTKEKINYKLLSNENIHDRWLLCDKQIYNLGGSVKDASQKDFFSVSIINPNETNMSKINQLIESGIEIKN